MGQLINQKYFNVIIFTFEMVVSFFKSTAKMKDKKRMPKKGNYGASDEFQDTGKYDTHLRSLFDYFISGKVQRC